MCSPSNPCRQRAGPSPHLRPTTTERPMPQAASSASSARKCPIARASQRHHRARRLRQHLVGTGCVSDNANTYFIGHNPGVFERVMDLEIGDKITVFDDDGASRTYYVFDTLFLPNGRTTSSTRAASRDRRDHHPADLHRRQPASALRHGPLGATGANVARSALLSWYHAYIRRYRTALDARGRGGIGIRSGLKIRLFGLWVRVPPPLPSIFRAASKIMPWRMSDSLAV